MDVGGARVSTPRRGRHPKSAINFSSLGARTGRVALVTIQMRLSGWRRQTKGLSVAAVSGVMTDTNLLIVVGVAIATTGACCGGTILWQVTCGGDEQWNCATGGSEAQDKTFRRGI